MMLEILEFIFSSFWVWLGSVILCGVVAFGMSRNVQINLRRDKREGAE